MRRWMAIALTVTLALSAMIGWAEEVETFMYAVSDQYVWKYAKEKMEVLAVDGAEVSGFACGEIEHMAATGEMVLVSRRFNGEHGIQAYDLSGRVIAEWPLPEDFLLMQFEVLGDQIVLLGTEENNPANVNRRGLLYRLDWETGALTPWTQDATREYSYFCLSEEGLLALDAVSQTLTVLDPSGNQTLELHPAVSLSAVTWCVAEDLCVGLTTASDVPQLTVINLETGVCRTAHSLSPALYAGLRCNAEGVYTEDFSAGQLVHIPWADLRKPESSRTLTIVNAFDVGSGRMNRALELLAERYPDVEVVFRTSNNDMQLATQIMAGDGGVDILFVQEGAGMCAQSVFHSGALRDLSQNSEIMANLAQWYDISCLISNADGVYGVPGLIWPYVWIANDSLLEELSWSLPQKGWMWEEFFAMGRELAQYNRENGTNYKLLTEDAFPYLLKQYSCSTVDIATGQASYDNETFRTLLSAWKEMVELNVVEKLEDPLDPEDLPANSVFCALSTTYPGLAMVRQPLAYPPVYGPEARYPVFSIPGVCNVNSPNVDVAEVFLACYASADAVSKDFTNGIGTVLADDVGESSPLSPEAEAYWKELLENGAPEIWFADIDRELQMNLYPQYLEGQMDVNQVTRVLQQKADMSLGE